MQVPSAVTLRGDSPMTRWPCRVRDKESNRWANMKLPPILNLTLHGGEWSPRLLHIYRHKKKESMHPEDKTSDHITRNGATPIHHPAQRMIQVLKTLLTYSIVQIEHQAEVFWEGKAHINSATPTKADSTILTCTLIAIAYITLCIAACKIHVCRCTLLDSLEREVRDSLANE